MLEYLVLLVILATMPYWLPVKWITSNKGLIVTSILWVALFLAGIFALIWRN